jgi:hypothetical protein
MYRMSVLYTPEKDIIKKFIKILKVFFNKNGIEVAAKNSAEAAITDILGSDIVVYTAGDEADIKNQFKEIIRAFKGMNLSGRYSAFVSFGKKSAALEIKNELADTGVTVYNRQLILDCEKLDEKFIRSWAEKLLKELKKNFHE